MFTLLCSIVCEGVRTLLRCDFGRLYGGCLMFIIFDRYCGVKGC